MKIKNKTMAWRIHMLLPTFWMALLPGCVPVVVPVEEPVDVQNVPEDRGRGYDGLYDYNDQPFQPQAFHRLQLYEWLGPGVSEENAPKPADDFDDGLVVVNPSGFRRPGGVVDLAVNVRTSFAQNPHYFPNTLEGRLAIWIDWNYNGTLAVNENVYNQPIDLPFRVENKSFSQAHALIPVTVPANFTPRLVMGPDPQRPGQQKVLGVENPPIRVRLAYGRKPTAPIDPGGEQSWGEVEDHAVSENDLAFFSDDPAAPSTIAALPPVLLATFRDMLERRLVLMRSDLEGQIVSRQGVDMADMATLVEFIAIAQRASADRGR